MKEEPISSSADPFLPPRSSSPPPNLTPAASFTGASSPAIPINAGSTDWFGQGHNSKGGSISIIGSHPMCTSLSTSAGGSTLGSSLPSCRPWERGDLMRRLSTFNPANWFGKPKAASSLVCARKGWVNVAVDKVECESCGAILKFISSATWTPSEAHCAGEDFTKRLDDGHKPTCPWIENCCAESLVQFPPTPPSALFGGYKDRCDGLLQFQSLPLVSASVIEKMRVTRGPEIDRLLTQSQFARSESAIKLEILLGTENSKEDVFFLYSRAQKVISLCGWEPRWLPNIQDCEEHSAQSARNGYLTGPSKHWGPPRDPSHGKNAVSSSTKRNCGVNEIIGTYSKSVTRSPLLDCSLCGATVRIWDFLTVSRPASLVTNITDVPETSKKMVLTCGVSAASGMGGCLDPDGTEKDQTEDRDEEGKTLSNVGMDLNLTISAGLSSSRLHINVMSEQYPDADRKRDLFIGQPSSSEVGDCAASYESRGPISRKRNLDEGGSTVDRPLLLVQQTDSVEGSVIDRDGDEVNDSGQYSGGPSKRVRDSDAGTSQTPDGKDSSGAGPSQPPCRQDSRDAGPILPFGFDIEIGTHKDDIDQDTVRYPLTRYSCVSSVIAMDTINHCADNDSNESVENYPGDFDDVHLPSTSTIKNTDPNGTQQSTCPVVVRSPGEMGVSSTNEDVVNADTATAHDKDGPSFGISGGSVGMGASHEAEIHGIDASVYRADSVVGDVEPIAEVTDNQGQTGEFGPGPGLMGDFVPEEMDREDPQGDSQDLTSQSIARADSGSKIVGSTKADSVESGEKTSNVQATSCEKNPHPSLSCNAIMCSGFEASKDLTTDDCGDVESGYQVVNGPGSPGGGNYYDEAVEFDPIKHHNLFCPWVNGNVAAAGCSGSNGPGSGAGAVALCGWQLTVDALDAFQSEGQVQVQMVESESAASMYKDDHCTPSRKLLAPHSFDKSHGKK